MTTPLLDGASAPSPTSRSGRRGSGLTVALPLLSAGYFLHHYGVPLAEVLAYAAYVLAVVLVPGALLWRALYRRGFAQGIPPWRTIGLEDVVCGAALGYALELVGYVVARILDHPRLYVLLPLGVAAGLLVRSLTRRLQSGDVVADSSSTPFNSLANWSTAAILVYVVVWYSETIFRVHPLNAVRITDPDEMFHLALVGDLRHHFPATYPYVDYPGDLTYQWFVHAHMAASSWITGIDPETLYRRFDPLMMTVLAVLGVAMLATKVSGRVAAGPLSAGVLVLVGSFDITGTTVGEASPEDRFLQGLMLMHSPTQAYAYVLSVPVILLAFDLLAAGPRSPRWFLLLITTAAVSGAKVAFLPLYACGYVASAAVAAMRRNGPRGSAVLAALLTAAVVLVSSLVLYRGDSQSLRLAPFQSADFYMAHLGISGGGPVGRGFIAASLIAMWLVPGAGGVALLLRPHTRWDPRVWFLLGAAAAGYGATFLLGHGGNSQLFFGRAAAPLIAIASGWGLALLLDGVSRRQMLALGFTALLAGAVLLLVRLVTEGLTQMSPLHGMLVKTPLLRIWVNLPVLLGIAVVMGVLRLLSRDLSHGARTLSLRTILVFFVGLGLARSMAFVVGHREPDFQPRPVSKYGADARRTALWLKGHSSSDDLVMTNAHCGPARPPKGKGCDARHFWMSALTERRFVLEGWAYTAKSASDWTADFWGSEQLKRRNDGLLSRPTDDRLRSFVRDYPVRWMFLDTRLDADVRGLTQLAAVRLVYRDGHFAVLHVDPTGGIAGITGTSETR